MAGEVIQLESGETMSVVAATAIIVEEVETLRAELANLAPGPSIPPTARQVQRLFEKLVMSTNAEEADGGAWQWIFGETVILRRDFSTGEWQVTLVP